MSVNLCMSAYKNPKHEFLFHNPDLSESKQKSKVHNTEMTKLKGYRQSSASAYPAGVKWWWIIGDKVYFSSSNSPTSYTEVSKTLGLSHTP